jgi:outer membrane protein assembly factor BamB
VISGSVGFRKLERSPFNEMIGPSNKTTFSMWKLLMVFVILLVVVAVGAAQRSGDAAVAVQQVTTITPHDLQPVPNGQVPAAERLARLHKALASQGDPHDVILAISQIGDATSVPFLIEALAKQGTVPREGPYGAICTRFHVLEALQEITNHDGGRNAEDWRPWYEKNKEKTQGQWIKDGFVEHGFPVSDPPDDAFVTALIRSSDPKYQPRYLQTNALRTLRTIPSDTVVRLAKALSVSKDSAGRRATVAALDRIDGADRLHVLRNLTKDSDVEVAESALRTLNEALRSTLPTIAAGTVWDIRLAKAGVHVLNVLDDHTVVLGIGYGIVDKPRVAGFDLVTHTITWTYPTKDGVRSNAVRNGDRLYFVSDDRVVHCISVRGKPVWAKPLTSNPDLGTTGPAIVAASGRLFVPDDKSVHVVTLDGQIQTYAMGEDVSRSLAQGRRRVFAAIHNGPLLVFDDPTQPPARVSTGLRTAALSAFGDVVCIVSFGPPYQLQCLEQETLRELWRVDLPDETGAYRELVQDGENVYVLGQSRALAFNVATGSRLWATDESTSGAFFKIFGRAAVTRNEHFDLEWRDKLSGEAIAVWGKRDGGFASNAVMVGEDLLVEISDSNDRGDGLHLLRVTDVLKQRFSVR